MVVIVMMPINVISSLGVWLGLMFENLFLLLNAYSVALPGLYYSLVFYSSSLHHFITFYGVAGCYPAITTAY